jgi:hypothetical protein
MLLRVVMQAYHSDTHHQSIQASPTGAELDVLQRLQKRRLRGSTALMAGIVVI